MILQYFQYLGGFAFAHVVSADLRMTIADKRKLGEYLQSINPKIIITNKYDQVPQGPWSVLDYGVLNWMLGWPRKFEFLKLEELTTAGLELRVVAIKEFCDSYPDHLRAAAGVTQAFRRCAAKFSNWMEPRALGKARERLEFETKNEIPTDLAFLADLKYDAQPRFTTRDMSIVFREVGLDDVRAHGLFGPDCRILKFGAYTGIQDQWRDGWVPVWPGRMIPGGDHVYEYMRRAAVLKFIHDEDLQVVARVRSNPGDQIFVVAEFAGPRGAHDIEVEDL